jgi:DNA-binding transcriptional MerR regulator
MYTIGELAKAAEVPSTTVRFYERKGLLTRSRPSKTSGSCPCASKAS